MEVLLELKNLYKHWQKHTSQLPYNGQKVELNKQILNKMHYLINERMQIYENKTLDKPKPWTDDPILQKYRFCNIYRELDRQTIQIHKALQPLKSDFALWLLNLAFYRFIANPSTNEQIGLLDFDKTNNLNVYEKLKALSRPKYGTAYLFPISVIQRSATPDRESFLCLHLPSVIQQIANVISKFNNLTINQALPEILKLFGFNFKFHWTEILIDVGYQFPELIELRSDFHIGPGALPTFKSLSSANPVDTANYLARKRSDCLNLLTFDGLPVFLSAENWEGIGCEFRKYMNLSQNTGRRRLYKFT